MLDKEHYISIIIVFSHKHYFALSMCPIKMRVKVAEICLIPPFGGF